jgi:alpha-1,3-rhamnosyl/mannosyltransferase
VRIGLSFAALVNAGGIGRYVRLLAKGLPKLFPEHSYIGYLPSFREGEIKILLRKEGIEGWETVTVPAGNRWAFETRGLPDVLNEDPPDIFHGPDYLAPKAPCPVCVTVHDLAFRLCPSGMALKSRFLFRMLTPRSLSRASANGAIFCDSTATLSDLRKLRWIDSKCGIVIPLACEDEFRERVPDNEAQQELDRHLLDPGYPLYVGPIEHRKNLEVLVEAYRIVATVLRKHSGKIHPLVATGPLGAGGQRLRKRLEKTSDGLFMYLGYVPRPALRALYQCCGVFCYPSLYEGFGLPPLEAMCAGKAVIVSDASSLPEVVGHAGILLGPTDAEGWSRAILRTLADEKYRRMLETASLEQSRLFSVERMCSEVMQGYLNALGGSIPG